MYREFRYLNKIYENGIMDILMSGASICDGTYRVERDDCLFYVFGQVLSGHGILQINKNQFHLNKGDIYILPKHSKHLYYSSADDPMRQVWFHADGKLVENLIHTYDLTNTFVIKDIRLNRFFNQINAIMKNNRTDEYEKIQFIFHDMIWNIHRFCKSQESKHSAIAAEIKNRLDMNLENRFSLRQISKETFLSKAQIINVFKRDYGTTPYDYVINRRMEIAKILLANQKNLSVSEIATRLSFTDAHYFSNFFKQRAGVSPSIYRKIMADVDGYLDAVAESFANMDKDMLFRQVSTGLRIGIMPRKIVENGLVSPLKSILELKRKNAAPFDKYLSLLSETLDLIQPYYMSPGRKMLESVVIGCLPGESNSVIKNITKMSLIGKGFTVNDLGEGVSAQAFIDGAIRTNSDIIVIPLSDAKFEGEFLKLHSLMDEDLRKRFYIVAEGLYDEKTEHPYIKDECTIPSSYDAGYTLFERLNPTDKQS